MKRPRYRWKCPKCGRRFANANQWHSCAVQPLEVHFRARDPHLKSLFQRFLALARRAGPVVVVPQKSKIALYASVTFAGVVVKKDHLRVGVMLSRRLSGPEAARIDAVHRYGPRTIGHLWKVRNRADLDGPVVDWIQEAYQRAASGEASGRP